MQREVSELRSALVEKHEQENAMLQVKIIAIKNINFLTKFCFIQNDKELLFFHVQILMRVEQEQKVADDARIFAEQDAAAQRYAAQVLQVSFMLFSCDE